MKTLAVLKAVYNQVDLVDKINENIISYSNPLVRTYVMDDASEDDTYAAYKKKSRKDLLVFFSSVNRGSSNSYLKLVEQCDEDFVIFSDGDDYLCKDGVDFVSRLINYEDFDVMALNGVRVGHSEAVGLASKSRVDLIIPPNVRVNRKIFGRNCKGCSDFFVTAAKNPGFLWFQTLVVRKELARQAFSRISHLNTDWLFEHELARISSKNYLRFRVVDRMLAILGVTPNSMGQDVRSQLVRQVQLVNEYWEDEWKKETLLNVITKKLNQFGATDFSHSDVCLAFAKAFAPPVTNYLEIPNVRAMQETKK
jgi:glycosyltransferase involved in cell wall biosynthesis